MIKLERSPAPLCLSPAEVKRLTDEFKATAASVWHIDELKKALLETSHGKCAYCECNVAEESKYMEVEHFRDKDSYPDHVVTWTNLLPSCKRCNGSKSTHDVVANPIINPYDLDPKDHFALRSYRLRAKSQIGKESIGVLNLNDSRRAVKVRFQLGEKIQKALEDACGILDTYRNNRATRTKNRLIGAIDGILHECLPTSEYAATAATIVHSEEMYTELVTEMKALKLWTPELEDMHTQSKAIVLD
jgi:hypothetical protein